LSPYFKLLDKVLQVEKDFLSRDHQNDIKNISKATQPMKEISKAFCLLCSL